ncbi:MAG: SHOCT domain-containing protein [Chloroflexota bacterium]|nr:SHOCT domain-containing protein [Chloroflexota bacterium]
MWYGDMGPWGWWMVVVGSLMWMGFLILIGSIAWAALRTPTERTEYAPRLTPLDLLKTRYARGEITREEFEQTKRDLA